VREVALTGSCRRAGAGAEDGDDASGGECTNFGEGFLGFWNRGLPSTSPAPILATATARSGSGIIDSDNKDATTTNNDDDNNTPTTSADAMLLAAARVAQRSAERRKNCRNLKRWQQNAEPPPPSQRSADQRTESFRQLLDPDLWSLEEEHIFAGCAWFVALRPSATPSQDWHDEATSASASLSETIWRVAAQRFQLVAFADDRKASTVASATTRAGAVDGVAIALCNRTRSQLLVSEQHHEPQQ
jgi:hypothetical protein